MFNNLRELVTSLPDEAACREYLAKQRWPDSKVICPHCGYGKCYVIEKGTKYKCGNPECYKKFSVKVGTIFEASNIPLTKWFMAVYLCTAHKKGISSYQLGKDIGVSQKCGWFMLHRIREMMRPKENIKLDNIVEVDEVYIGGKISNMSKYKRTKIREEGRTNDIKTMVMGMVERGGNLKLIPIGKTNNVQAIQPTVKDNVDKDAVLITDSLSSYYGLDQNFAGHEIINHNEMEYVRDKTIHTNTIEGAFSHLKRSIYGIYHYCTVKHLSRYCDETAFRYNLRKMKDPVRFTYSLQNLNGRLKWKTLIGIDEKMQGYLPPEKNELITKRQYKRRPIVQILNGEVVAEFPSIRAAARALNLHAENIRAVLTGRKRTTGGFHWKYV